MKKKSLTYLFFPLISLFSCGDKEIKEVNDFISVNESKQNKSQTKIVENVRENLLAQRKELSRSQQSLPDHLKNQMH